MRILTDHRVNGLNEALEIKVIDDPGSGGANHAYTIWLNGHTLLTTLVFQNGPVAEAGFNGISNEALLAVLIDRMRGFQFSRDPDGNFSKAPGTYACRENAIALTHLEEALMWLQKRTRDRMARGVEGTMKV